MLPALAELRTESDVEQKLIWPLLTGAHPSGLAYAQSDVVTKLSIRRLEIGKGTSKKLYYPDYVVVLAGLPVLVVEAKAVGESLDVAMEEARLYAAVINASFPHSVNPVLRVVACNGEETWSAFADSDVVDIRIPLNRLSAACTEFAEFVDACGKRNLQNHADLLRRRLRPREYRRPVSLVGGKAFQATELPQNTFGASIASDFGHIFSPKTRQDREQVVRNAYVASHRRQRYVEPIDRLIRNAVAPSANKIKPLQDSSCPSEITSVLLSQKKLDSQVLLLVGSVGAGKSTFIDYLSLVALPEELRSRTVWLRLDLNDAPMAIELAYKWTAERIVEEFRESFQSICFDELACLEKVFHRELSALRKGALALLDSSSVDYKVRISDRIRELQSDSLAMAKGLAAYLCTGAGRLMIVAMDNCDKRTRDDQLAMFQLAQWVRSEFLCLVVLPLRDVTYDLHHGEPPLDTALKQLVFRIEPPQFSDVLQARVRLALEAIARSDSSTNTLSYVLPNGFRVTYPAQDQSMYLASILRSLYAHDRFVRQVMTGLAGRDVRRALEIFLEFCMSGHIGEDQIFKIRHSNGQYVLPLSIVARVLLRLHRRYYDGTRSYIKNIVQCDPQDALPDHFVRPAILHWYSQRLKKRGPAGVEGFHRVEDMVGDLSLLGHDGDRTRKELSYLAREGLLVAEHLRTDSILDGDLVKITASGVVHLQLLVNPEYLAACAEDTWIGDEALWKRVAGRLGGETGDQFSPVTTARNAKELVEYLANPSFHVPGAPELYLAAERADVLRSLGEVRSGILPADVGLAKKLFIGNIPPEATEDDLRAALVSQGVSVRELSLPMDRTTGRHKGFGFVRVDTEAEVLSALDCDERIVLGGRKLRVQETRRARNDLQWSGRSSQAAPPLSDRVYVGNLPHTYEEADLRGLLAQFDLTPSNIHLLRDKGTRASKGVAFIEAHSLDEASQIIGVLNDLPVEGRRIVAQPAGQRRQG